MAQRLLQITDNLLDMTRMRPGGWSWSYCRCWMPAADRIHCGRTAAALSAVRPASLNCALLSRAVNALMDENHQGNLNGRQFAPATHTDTPAGGSGGCCPQPGSRPKRRFAADQRWGVGACAGRPTGISWLLPGQSSSRSTPKARWPGLNITRSLVELRGGRFWFERARRTRQRRLHVTRISQLIPDWHRVTGRAAPHWRAIQGA